MTNDEKRKQAVATELEIMRKCVSDFDSVIESARRLADDCLDSLVRFESIQRQAQMDDVIDRLDRMCKRGEYRETLVDSFENANPEFANTLHALDALGPKTDSWK